MSSQHKPRTRKPRVDLELEAPLAKTSLRKAAWSLQSLRQLHQIPLLFSSLLGGEGRRGLGQVSDISS